MRRLAVVTLAALLMAALTVGTVAAVGGAWKAPPFSSIGISNVEVDSTFREEGSPSVLDIFIETGSANPRCLVTLNEISGSLANVEMVFCAAREPSFDGGQTSVKGVFVHVFFFDDPGPDLYLAVNVYQEGARFWSQPRYCSGENGC